MDDGITAQLSGEIPTLVCYNNYFVDRQSRDFSSSYAVIPSFISCFTTFYCLDPEKYTIIFIIAYSYTCVAVLLG